MPLLWYLRDILGLAGSKFGCGVGLCGACTVHVNGQATRSCVTIMRDTAKEEVTIATPRRRASVSQVCRRLWRRSATPFLPQLASG
jgi:isoquinoline 1-oxidoreductase subunit alpha